MRVCRRDLVVDLRWVTTETGLKVQAAGNDHLWKIALRVRHLDPDLDACAIPTLKRIEGR